MKFISWTNSINSLISSFLSNLDISLNVLVTAEKSFGIGSFPPKTKLFFCCKSAHLIFSFLVDMHSVFLGLVKNIYAFKMNKHPKKVRRMLILKSSSDFRP